MGDDGVDCDQLSKMGASGNPHAVRLASLQERKKTIEASLTKCTAELKRLCLQEADLTGIIPQEMPLEPGESPPLIRRRVGTAFQLPENLVKNANNNKGEPLSDLELQMQLHANMAEAALGLANEHNISKTLRRQHMADYQQHKYQYNTLQEKLTVAKETVQQQQELQKLRKKPRPEEDADSISVGTSIGDSYAKSSELTPSLRSYRDDSNCMSRPAYKSFVEASYVRHEEALANNFYRLSINGYKNYMERIDNVNTLHQTPSYNSLHARESMHMQNPHQHSHQRGFVNYPPKVLRSPHRQSSPKMYYNMDSASVHSYRMSGEIQPHQQYEHMSSGLGGYWKKLDNGDVVWCNSSSSPVDVNWQRDRRFGSLDRRKKRINKRISPSVDPKSATLAAPSTYADHVRTAAIKSPRVITKRNHDHMQLVRTQSLGSVGAQTVDSIYASDENNSSCESDNRSLFDNGQNIRKHKQKQWVETSLDGPVSPTHSVISRSQSALSTILSPEEKYIPSNPASSPPTTSKMALEIPAESHPSLRLINETNMELFNNNNIPKHCTVVQAGHCKPYHEETKPFEMSDFYKYSTKYKKSPVKANESVRNTPSLLAAANFNHADNLNDTYDSGSMKSHNYNNNSPIVGRIDNSGSSLSTSLNMSQLSNVAEHFSDEMNAWYKNHKLQNIDNNQTGTTSKSKSTTATLV